MPLEFPPLDYSRFVPPGRTGSPPIPNEALITALEEAWIEAYCKGISHAPNVLKFQDAGFTFLFDQTSGGDSAVEDRLVAGYGSSVPPARRRDSARMAGFLGGRLEIPGKGTFDKGHVLAHGMGGGLDVNLFPHRPELNRGRSSEGKKYRSMERYAAAHPGTFVFSRFWYTDPSWVPVALEYGLLRPDGTFWVERFAN